MTDLAPIACALFLIAAFVLAGVAQTAWLGSRTSRRFAVPLDGARTFRGRRIFGDNKTARGFLVMVPATGAAFWLLARLIETRGPLAHGLWPLTLAGYWWLGVAAGFGFMLGELPNSFLKRQLGIPPGEASHIEIYLGHGKSMGTDNPSEGARIEPIDWSAFIGGARVKQLYR